MVAPAAKTGFPRLTREQAADPRCFAAMAEAVASISSKADSVIAPVDAQRMLGILDSVCHDLTRRRLHEANEIEGNALDVFRQLMQASEKEIQAVAKAMAGIDAQWLTVKDMFGDDAPEIPPQDDQIAPVDKGRNERLRQKAENYLDSLLEIVNDMLSGKTSAVDAQRKVETIRQGCLILTGEELSDVADRYTHPIRRFRGLAQTPRSEFAELRRAYYAIDGVTRAERSKWDDLIRLAKCLQWQAKHDPAKFMAYVFRDADPSHAGMVLDLQWFHVSWFGVWMDRKHAHSLIMAPPGHGKSFCACAMDLWECGNRPELRFLVLYDKGDDKVAKEIMRIEGIMQSDLYRAVFPDIRILDRSRTEAASSVGKRKIKRPFARRHARTQYAFTVARKNDLFSREATFEGAGTLSNINGDGFDRIRGDDFSPPNCRHEPYNRKRYADRFANVVEERQRDSADFRIRVIHTPWHPDDAPGRIRRDAGNGKMPNWRVQIEPYAIKDDAQGKAIPLWPAKRSREQLEERKFRLACDYDCCYRLLASDVSRRALSKLRYYNALEANATDRDREILGYLSEARRTLSIDPAGSDDKAASDTGAIDGRITLEGRGYVANVWMLHYRSTQLLEWIVEQIRDAWKLDRHPYDELLVESQGGIKGMVNLFEDFLPKMLDEAGVPKAVWPAIITPGTRVGQGDVGRNRGKFQRLREAAPYLERGAVRLAGRRVIGYTGPEGNSKHVLECIPNTPISRLAAMVLEFDGSTRFDAGDALTQWILYNKNRLADPWAKQETRPAPSASARPPDTMARAMAKTMDRLMNPPEEDSEDDAGKAFSKYDKVHSGGYERW